jgi:hypothetical protein
MSMLAEPAGVIRARGPVDWGAILAGATLATALGLVLLAFGASLGLSVSSPYEGEGLSPVAYAVAAGLYLLWVQLLCFSFGGYVAARLRQRVGDANEHEVDVRDGLHGLLVWGTGVIAAAIIAFASVGGVTAATRTADTRGDVMASVAAVASERLAEGAAAEKTQTPEAATASATERRAEVARKLTIISAFITAASLLAGAVAAFFFAGVGGRHRDENTVVPLFALRKHSALW